MIRTPLLRALQRALREAATSSTRREFLKEASVIGATALAFPSLSKAATLLDTTHQQAGRNGDKVFILGGGVSGLVAAYTLQKAGIQSVVYEGSSRLGGRVFTLENFNDEGMFCELGGELLDSDHTDTLTLAEELGLGIDDFRSGDQGIEPFHFYFGGKHYYEKDLVEPFKPMAKHFQEDLKDLFADPATQVINYSTATEKAKKLDLIPLSTYLDQMTDVEEWVRELMRVAYIAEYGLEAEDQSAISLLMLMPDMSPGFRPYGTSDECKRIKGGNSNLVKALLEKLKGKVDVHVDRRLTKIERNGSQFQLSFRSGDQHHTHIANQVICTIPFSILRSIEGIETLGLTPRKLACIREFGYGKNSKHMLGFNRRVWREGDRKSTGLTFTNLSSQCFWETSRSQPGTQGILTNFLGGQNANQISSRDTVLQELELIYPGAQSAFNGKETQFNWGEHAWSKGSYSSPKIGQMTQLMGCQAEPEFEGNLLFAGEHVSEAFIGFINGAVETGQNAAKMMAALRKKTATRRHAVA